MKSPLYQACVDQGNLVRDLKTKKAEKGEVSVWNFVEIFPRYF